MINMSKSEVTKKIAVTLYRKSQQLLRNTNVILLVKVYYMKIYVRYKKAQKSNFLYVMIVSSHCYFLLTKMRTIS